MDGWGDRFESSEEAKSIGDATKLGSTPNVNSLKEKYFYTKLNASGNDVGLPEGTLGGSEVGHLHLGAGRIVPQTLTLINQSIDSGEFFENQELTEAIEQVKENNSSLHLMGLVSDGGIHSHIHHLEALLELAAKKDLDNVFVHCFLDGRDTAPKVAKKFVSQVKDKIEEVETGEIATVSGRYYAMDRDQRWDRTEEAYQAIVRGNNLSASDPNEAIEQAYDRGESDEFVKPTVIDDYQGIDSKDSIIYFNFRSDRAQQLTEALTDQNFDRFETDRPEDVMFTSMTSYGREFDNPYVFDREEIENTLGEILAETEMKQMRLAETEKQAHVTYFFNGERDIEFDGEERKIYNSPKVSTYDQTPEMRANKICQAAVEEIDRGRFDFILINFANGDMVGHTGDLDAAIKAVESVDESVGKLVEACSSTEYTLLVTADHGNCDRMIDQKGGPHTAHTFSKVPFIVVDDNYLDQGSDPIDLDDPGLSRVAPTVLELLDIDRPEEMKETLLGD